MTQIQAEAHSPDQPETFGRALRPARLLLLARFVCGTSRQALNYASKTRNHIFRVGTC
ncbi:MAG: hypothetical protein OXE59_11275 [Bacteroidetes bacterium]|nr:hypothetical protein [Bacteroidota bacterium]MCY4234304.1 hypothetical protein [Bacteroidota bacterium]